VSLGAYIARRLLAGIPLLLGVSLVAFLLMVYFGTDAVYSQIGHSATPQQIEELRRSLGHDQPVVLRYFDYLRQLATLDFGRSDSSGEPVAKLLARTVPVSIRLVLPGFVLGNLFGLGLALLCLRHRGSLLDRLIVGGATLGMSLSFVIVIVGLQALLGSSAGLDLLPVRGWDDSSWMAYLNHVAVPTLALIVVTLGYNTRFYRAVLLAEADAPHVRTARAYGAGEWTVLLRQVLRNALLPIVTRLVFSVPMIAISGSLLIESYFGIPGVGKATFDAITSGDQPVLKAVVGLSAVLFVLMQIAADVLCRLADPRVQLR